MPLWVIFDAKHRIELSAWFALALQSERDRRNALVVRGIVTDADVVLARASRGYWLRPHDCMFLLCTEELISARCVSVVD